MDEADLAVFAVVALFGVMSPRLGWFLLLLACVGSLIVRISMASA